MPDQCIPSSSRIRRELKSGLVIWTSYDPPPIPNWEDVCWSAVTDDYEGGDPIGRGPSEDAAVEDLLQLLENA